MQHSNSPMPFAYIIMHCPLSLMLASCDGCACMHGGDFSLTHVMDSHKDAWLGHSALKWSQGCPGWPSSLLWDIAREVACSWACIFCDGDDVSYHTCLFTPFVAYVDGALNWSRCSNVLQCLADQLSGAWGKSYMQSWFGLFCYFSNYYLCFCGSCVCVDMQSGNSSYS